MLNETKTTLSFPLRPTADLAYFVVPDLREGILPKLLTDIQDSEEEFLDLVSEAEDRNETDRYLKTLNARALALEVRHDSESFLFLVP